MTKKLVFGLLKCFAACLGPVCIIYSKELFDEYFEHGAKTPHGVYVVPLDNHGVYRYITEEQNRHFEVLLGLTALWVICLFAVIYFEKFKK